MAFKLDIQQAMNTLWYDAQDTIAKLMTEANIFRQIHECAENHFSSEFNDYPEWRSMATFYRSSESKKIRDGFTCPIGNHNVQCQMTDSEAGGVRVYALHFKSGSYERIYTFFWDHIIDYWNFPGEEGYENKVYGSFDLTSEEILPIPDIGGISFAGLIQNLKSCVQTQQFISDLSLTIKNRSSFVTLFNVWTSKDDLTANFRQVLNDFSENGSGSLASAVQWLYQIYKNASQTTVSNDDEITFSDTSFKVTFAWSTMIGAIGQAISSALVVITMALNGVFRAIAAVLAIFGSLVANLFGTATNPLCSYDDTKRMTLNIPIAQLNLPTDNSFDGLGPLKACTIDIGCVTFRYWIYDSGTDKVEIFLKPKYDVDDLIRIRSTRSDSVPGWLGVTSADQVPDDYVSQTVCGPQCCVDEGGQAIIMAANLYLLVDSLMYPRGTALASSVSLETLKSYIAGSDATNKRNAVYTWLYRCYDYATTNRSQVLDNSTAAQTVKMALMSWLDLCNTLIPAIRSVWTDDIPDGYGMIDWSTFGSQNFNDLCQTQGATIDLGALPADSYGVSLPKNSSKGLILGMIVTLVATIAITAAVIVTAHAVRKQVTKFRLGKANQCAKAKTDYENAMNGKDVNNPDSGEHVTYTKAQLNAYYNKYYRSVKSYNRLSVLWGGSTWNAVNGWDDGAPSVTPYADPTTDNPVASLLSSYLPTDNVSYEQGVVNLYDVIKLLTGPSNNLNSLTSDSPLRREDINQEAEEYVRSNIRLVRVSSD